MLYPSLIDRLNTQHQAIDEILVATGEQQLLARPQPTKWNIHEQVAHLASYQPVFIDRMNQILTSVQPFFDRYSAPEDPNFIAYTQRPINDLLLQLHQDRKTLAELVLNLSGTSLARQGVHQKYGRLNIPGWTEFFLLHEAHHLFAIFQLAHDSIDSVPAVNSKA